jgi:hypothetical protein
MHEDDRLILLSRPWYASVLSIPGWPGNFYAKGWYEQVPCQDNPAGIVLMIDGDGVTTMLTVNKQ